MANIPTIPGTAAVQDQAIGVKMDPTAGLQLNEQVAKTVGTAADIISAYEEKKQKAVEFDISNKAYLSFTDLRQQFDQQAKTLPPDQIVAHWQEMANNWKASQVDQYGSKLSPEARQDMLASWDRAIIGARGDAQVIADRKQHAEWEGTLNLAYDKAAQSLNEDVIKATKAQGQQAVALGIKTKDQVADMDYKLDVRFQESQISSALEGSVQDKMVMQEKLKDKNQLTLIPTMRRPAFIHQLKESIAGDQARNGEMITDRIVSGDPKDWPNTEELHNEYLAGNITATREKNLMNLMSSITKRTSEETAKSNRDITSLASLQIYNHDWKNDPNPRETYKDISDQVSALPPALTKTILKEAAAKRDAALRGEIAKEKPVKSSIFKIGEKNYALGLFRPPLKKEVPEKPSGWALIDYFSKKVNQTIPATADSQWIKHSSPEAVAAAAVNYAQWQSKMREYFDGKDAKNEPYNDSEAMAYSLSITNPDLENQVTNALFGKK